MKRFETKQEIKILNKISKILNDATIPTSEEEAIKKDECCVTDPCNVCMIVAKTEQAKRSLSRFKEKNDKTKEPQINFFVEKEEVMSRYSTDYLKRIIDFMNCVDEATTIRMRHDHPIMMENEHFKTILAARIQG